MAATGDRGAGASRQGGPVRPGRLRRRLTVAVVLVAALSAGALALGSYVLVRGARLGDSLARAERQARVDLALAADLRFEEGADPQAFVAGYQQRGVDAVLLVDGARFASNPTVDPPVPDDLRALVRSGQLGYRRIEHGGVPYLAVGGRPPRSEVELYFFHSEEALARDLSQLGAVLLAGWAAVTLVAGLVGRSLARRVLDPVARASGAARALAEGLLATRLPVAGDDEFAAWAASFNQMADALEAKITALSEARARERRFTADVAHELRTPLTALVGEASLLAEHLDRMPPDARRPAELLVRDVARFRRLVDELMELSRLDAGREEVAVEPVDVRALVTAVVRARGWDGAVEIEGPDLALRTDPRRLERVVANLVGNAVEHGRRGVRVVLGRADRSATVQVADEGPGIPPEDLPHVFERFYKADRARAGGGSGLGLAIAQENARLLGGHILAWSEPGRGTRFTLVLPVSEPLPGGEGPVTGEADAGAEEKEGGRI